MLSRFPKTYDHASEPDIYQCWEDSGYFNPDALPCGEKAPVFSISMPPPNVTGVLHLGHALENSIMDTMIRYQRMRGTRALLLPGTDHAAVATQARVEKNLIDSGKHTHPREELGREKLLEIIRQYAEESKATILSQIRKMGTSCDWSRLAYTFDEECSRAVNELFIRMYQDGLIYRGYRVVNWSVRGQSTCSDDELVHKERPAKLYTFRYDADFPIAISTTRPETKLGDTAVAVHPDDARYKKYIGRTFTVEVGAEKPLPIKIIADAHVDPTFGTGALGVTPAHSPTDYEMYEQRKGAPDAIDLIPVIGADGRMTARAGKAYAGLTVEDAREKFIAALRTQGLLQKEEDINQNVGVSDRFGDIVEAVPMEQWFVAVNKQIPSLGKTLKDLMRDAVTTGHRGDKRQKVNITPERFEKTYLNWIDNLRDWCISRQIWWGHRIPVWYCANNESGITNQKTKNRPHNSFLIPNSKTPCQQPIVSTDTIEECPHCHGKVTQDPDTLDTWFSSGAWTFSTLGWPDAIDDLKTFHPTTWMQMGHEILFFWMARMILMSTYALDEIPFKDVYIHGILRDEQGRKFSKSLGNGIDPLVIIEKYGADALRLALLIGITPGNDARFYEEKVAHYGTFINKLWNISRFILTTCHPEHNEGQHKKTMLRHAQHDNNLKPQTLADEWILTRLNETIRTVTDHFEHYRFSQAIETLYEFTWHEFADWYIEIAKFQRTHGAQESTDAILLYALEYIIKLWHPFAPFVTEQLWSHLNVIPGSTRDPENKKEKGQSSNLLLIQRWPEEKKHKKDRIIFQFGILQILITSLRVTRAETKLNPKVNLTGFVVASVEWKEIISNHLDLIEHLTKTKLTFTDKIENPLITLSGIQVSLNLQNTILTKKEAPADLKRYIAQLETRLSDPSFLTKAPQQVVEKERMRLKEMKEKIKDTK